VQQLVHQSAILWETVGAVCLQTGRTTALQQAMDPQSRLDCFRASCIWVCNYNSSEM